MADIMEEGGRCDEPRLAGIEPEVAAHDPGQVHRPEGVLNRVMVAPGGRRGLQPSWVMWRSRWTSPPDRAA